MTSFKEPTAEEKRANDDAMVRQGGATLVQVGQLILYARELDCLALLDWPQLSGFITETVLWAAGGAGFEHDEIAPRITEAVAQDKITEDGYRKLRKSGKGGE
jgi:hypothetical protein